MEYKLEKSIKRFLKRKIKITFGFIVAFLLMCTAGYSEIINQTVSIESKDGKIVIMLNGTEIGKVNENNSWTNSNIIDVQTGNGIEIYANDENFKFINNGIIKGNENGKHSGNGIFINSATIGDLKNYGIITGNTNNASEAHVGNGILNWLGVITTLENYGIITGNENIIKTRTGSESQHKNNGILNGRTIENLINSGIITGNGNGSFYIGNGINNSIPGTIKNLRNNGIVTGNGSGNVSGNGISNDSATITNLENYGIITGNGNGSNSGNINNSGNGIYSGLSTLDTLINSGTVLGNGVSGSGIYKINGTVNSLTNYGIIAGRNKAIEGIDKNIINNYGLLVDRTGTDTLTLTFGTEGKIEDSQSKYKGYAVMNGEVVVENKKTKDISASSLGEKSEKYIFNLADSSFTVNKNFTLTNGIINSYQSSENKATVQIKGENTFTGENVIFNGITKMTVHLLS